MDRRDFILGTAGLTLASLGERLRFAAAAERNPSFDASYSRLPTLDEQTKALDSAALAAQATPRTVHAMPVTGMPHDLGKFDEDIATSHSTRLWNAFWRSGDPGATKKTRRSGGSRMDSSRWH